MLRLSRRQPEGNCPMPMLRTCSAPGCNTLTLGELCLEHEAVNVSPVAAQPDLVRDLVRESAAARAPARDDATIEAAKG